MSGAVSAFSSSFLYLRSSAGSVVKRSAVVFNHGLRGSHGSTRMKQKAEERNENPCYAIIATQGERLRRSCGKLAHGAPARLTRADGPAFPSK